MKKITRRNFMQVSAVSVAAVALAACQQEAATTTTTTSTTTSTDSGTTTSSVVSSSDEAALSDMEMAVAELDASRGDGKTIGVIAFNQANDWNIQAVLAIEEYFEPYGYSVTTIDTNGDAAAASAAVDTFITSGVDGIVISGGEQSSLTEAAAKIVASGIPYSCIDMFQDGSVICTMADNWGGGTQLGLWVLNKIEGEGTVLILDTPSWATLLARADSADIVFDAFTNIETYRYDIDASNAVADSQTQVAAALSADTNHEIKAIITSWNLPAVGAYAALLDAGRDDIVIASGDTGTDVMLAMREDTAPEWVFMGQGAYTLAERASMGLDLAINGMEDIVPFAMFGPTYFVSNSAEPYGEVLDGSNILLQSPEEHWEAVLDRPYGE